VILQKAMEREAKQHLIYSAVLLVVIVGILLYQNSVITDTKQELQTQNALLQQQIETLQNELSDEVQTLSQDINTLNSSIEQKGDEIQSLTGEIADVKTEQEEQVAALEKSIAGLQVEFQDFSEIIEDSVRSVVSVQTNHGSGSGFFTNNNGFIITNNHVIDGASAAQVVTHDGKKHQVFLVGTNQKADLAVLRINDTSYPTLSFGNSESVKVGEKAIAIGNPGGLDFTVTQGIISNIDRTDENDNEYPAN